MHYGVEETWLETPTTVWLPEGRVCSERLRPEVSRSYYCVILFQKRGEPSKPYRDVKLGLRHWLYRNEIFSPVILGIASENVWHSNHPWRQPRVECDVHTDFCLCLLNTHTDSYLSWCRQTNSCCLQKRWFTHRVQNLWGLHSDKWTSGQTNSITWPV